MTVTPSPVPPRAAAVVPRPRRGAQRTLDEAVADYHLHRHSQGLATNTLRRDATHLRALLAHLGDRTVAGITVTHLDGFYAARSRELAGNSVNTMSCTLRPFFRFCVRRGYLRASADPVADRRRHPFLERPKLRLPATSFRALLDAADEGRDRVLVALGLYTLMRRGEIARLLVGDVDLAAGSIAIVVPKSRSRDDLPVCAELDVELGRWFEEYAARLGRPLRPGDVLVPRRTTAGQPRGNQYLGGIAMRPAAMALDPTRAPYQMEQTVTALLRRLGHPTRDGDGRSLGEGMHTLRRSGARARFDVLVASGYDGAIREVQSLLHHRSVTTTERYLGLDLDVAKRNANLRGRVMYPVGASSPTRGADATGRGEQ